jgi:hypothetical protein
MQVITVVGFNMAIFSYSLIQINQTNKLQSCSDDFIAIYDAPGYPTISSVINPLTQDYVSLFLVAGDNSISLDLLGMCPWSLEPGFADLLKRNMYLLNPVRIIQLVIIAVTALGNILGTFFAYKVYQGEVQGNTCQRVVRPYVHN